MDQPSFQVNAKNKRKDKRTCLAVPLRYPCCPMSGQFENLTASELHCPRCKTLRPVRERLLLVLPHGELHDYRCQVCGESLGTREVASPPPGLVGRDETQPRGG